MNTIIFLKKSWKKCSDNRFKYFKICFSVDIRALLPNKHGRGRREECDPGHQAGQPGQSVRVQPVLTPRGDHPRYDGNLGPVCYLSINMPTILTCGRFMWTADCISLKPASQCYNMAIVSRCELFRL